MTAYNAQRVEADHVTLEGSDDWGWSFYSVTNVGARAWAGDWIEERMVAAWLNR